MSAHTPGPWSVEHDPSNAPLDGIHSRNAILGDTGQGIVGYTVGFDESDREQANAHLIAAAPELLAACKAYKDQWREPGEGHTAYFERQAERFYRATGMIAPGKAQPAEIPNDHEARRAAWEAFVNGPYNALCSAIAKAEGGAS